jgi:hypothetical protein
MALAGPAPQPTAYNSNSLGHLAKHRFQIEVPAEILLAAEDQAQSQGMSLAKWIQEYAVLGLQMQLFG